MRLGVTGLGWGLALGWVLAVAFACASGVPAKQAPQQTPQQTAQQTTPPKKHVLVGRVRTPDRQGVANAEVVVRWRVAPELPGLVGWSLGGEKGNGTARVSTRTDARGAWRLQLPVAGPFEVVATSADGSQQTIRRFPVMASGFVEQVVEPAYSLQGVVRDPQGELVKDFALRFEPHHTTWTRLAVYGMPLTRRLAKTDADGRFSLPFASAYVREPMWEPYLQARPFDPAMCFVRSPLLQPIADCRNMNLQLEMTPLQKGFVRDVKGKGLEGARVYLRQEPWRHVFTKKDGSFVIPAGRPSLLAASADGYSPQKIAGLQAQGKPGQELKLELWPVRRLQFRLVGVEGAVLADHEVLWSFQFADEPPLERLAQSDHDGQLVLEDAPLSMVTMGFVKVDGVWCRFLRTMASQNLQMKDHVVQVRSVSGAVTNVDGAPVPGARMVAVAISDGKQANPSSCMWVTYADHGGRYRFPSLPAGALYIMCDASTDGFTRVRVAPEVTLQDLHVPAGGVAGVHVIDNDGRPVAGAWVMLTSAGGLTGLGHAPSPTPNQTSVVGFTDEQGNVNFRGLPEGRWQIFGHVLRDGVLFAGVCKGLTGDTGLLVELK